MNSFGRLFRVSIYGESHGNSVGVILDGVPAGIELKESDFDIDIDRRKSGKKGTTPRVEADNVIIESGVFNGYTTGAPVLLKFNNTNTRSKDYSNLVKTPRPGHADYTASVKFKGYQDYRGGGAFSGRLTTGIVAAGVVAKKITGYSFDTKIINLAGETNEKNYDEVLDKALLAGDSIGGIVNVKVNGVEKGLGEPYFDSVESVLSHLLFSVGGVKGVEFGVGFDGVALHGSEYNDCFIDKDGHTKTNNNGGINGGIANGNEIDVKIAIKPTPSIYKTQATYNFSENKIVDLKIEGRHDCAIILRAQVVLEAMIAIGLCDLALINKAYK
ncbi:MAG: chorismate synthase [Anaeroplasmataceae bacterium]